MILEINKNIFLKEINLEHTILRMRNDGIVQINFGDNIELDGDKTKEIVNTIGILTEGKKALILDIAGENTTAGAEARSYSASVEGNRFTIADAFVVNSLAQKLIVNFYLNFHKPVVPTKAFDGVDKAIEWLKSHAV